MPEDIAAGLGLPKDHGEIVARVEPGEAAARAGIRQGDVIVKVNGQDVSPDNTLSYIVAKTPVGTKMPIELIREGQRKSVVVTIGERPPEDQLASAANPGDDDNADATPQGTPDQSTRNTLGLGFQTLTPDIDRRLGLPGTLRGVVVNYVDPSSDAGAVGLQVRDVILQIDQTPVTTSQAAAAAIEAARKTKKTTVLVRAAREQSGPLHRGQVAQQLIRASANKKRAERDDHSALSFVVRSDS